MASVATIQCNNNTEDEQFRDDQVEDSTQDSRSNTSSPCPSNELDDDDDNFNSSTDNSQDECYSPQRVMCLDPSEHFRPETNGKAVEEFRRYSHEEEDQIQQRVRRTYYEMHRNQTVDFVRSRMAKWMRFDHAELTIMEALETLNNLIDESDPDSDLPNIVHAFQTAERIRETYPDQEWFHLTGLIHDLGKVMALWGEKQWAVVGDTFLVGCLPSPNIVYREHSFEGNPDMADPRYNTKFGIYKPNCGLDNVIFSWGHDEYMARVLQNHQACTLPKIAISIIRYHSFYPWHSGGDYRHLSNEDDMKTLDWILEFNKFDLYTKSAPIPDIKQLMPYYQGLIDKYIPGTLKW